MNPASILEPFEPVHTLLASQYCGVGDMVGMVVHEPCCRQAELSPQAPIPSPHFAPTCEPSATQIPILVQVSQTMNDIVKKDLHKHA